MGAHPLREGCARRSDFDGEEAVFLSRLAWLAQGPSLGAMSRLSGKCGQNALLPPRDRDAGEPRRGQHRLGGRQSVCAPRYCGRRTQRLLVKQHPSRRQAPDGSKGRRASYYFGKRQSGPSGIVANASGIYWTNNYNATVMWLPIW